MLLSLRMKNLYFTVNLNVAAGEYRTKGTNTGFAWLIMRDGVQLAFTIIADSSDGIADCRASYSYILKSFREWIISVTDIVSSYSFAVRRVIRDVKGLIRGWNEYMYEHSCNQNGMNASVTILIATGKHYVLFQTGKGTVCCCTGRGVKVRVTDGDALGRHSGCVIHVNKGRVRYGDTFVMCRGNRLDDNSLWYIKKLIQKRKRFTVHHGRGMSGADVVNCITDRLGCSTTAPIAAVLCCERMEQ